MSRHTSTYCREDSKEKAFTVKVANNGTQAIQLARIEDFDVAVLDLKMDDMDGIEVLKDIQKDGNLYGRNNAHWVTARNRLPGMESNSAHLTI